MTTAQAPTTIARTKLMLRTLDEIEHHLSTMCTAGWAPVSVIFGCTFGFTRTEPGEYVCASAATIKMSGFLAGSFDRAKYRELAALLEAQGAFVVPQSMNFGEREGIIAVRRADQGPLEINSDIGSKIEDLRARKKHHLTLAFTYLVLAMAIFGLTDNDGGIVILVMVAAYGWRVYRYSAAIKRLQRNREIFE